MESLLTRLSTMSHWQIALLATYLLYQGAFFTVFPEEVIVTTLGLLWGQGKIGFFEALFAILLGLLPANSTTVFIGDRFGSKVLSVRPFSWVFKKDGVQEALGKIKKHGRWLVFGTRFTPMIRGPIYLACGLSKMGVLNFMRVDGTAALIQVPALLFLGRSIGKNAGSMMEGYQRVGILMLGLIVCAAAVNMFLNFNRRRFARSAQGIKAKEAKAT